jgi:hypothetical protein
MTKKGDKPTGMRGRGGSISREEIDVFERLQAQLKGFYDEMQTLVKKSPNDGVNTFKLGLINKALVPANDFLGADRIPFDDFSQFDKDAMPSNSDVLMVLSQYLNCLDKIRADNVVLKYRSWFWLVDGVESDIRTGPPKKIDG